MYAIRCACVWCNSSSLQAQYVVSGLRECSTVFHQTLHPERSPALFPVSPQLTLLTLRCLNVVNTMWFQPSTIRNYSIEAFVLHIVWHIYVLCLMCFILHTNAIIKLHLLSLEIRIYHVQCNLHLWKGSFLDPYGATFLSYDEFITFFVYVVIYMILYCI